MTFRILLPAEFQDIHRQAAVEWVARGHQFRQREWRVAFRAFDLLKEAAVVTTQGVLPFSAVYFRHIEEPYADRLIRSLLAAEDVTRAGIAGWAEVASRIPDILHEAGLFPAQQPAARLLVAYCLFCGTLSPMVTCSRSKCCVTWSRAASNSRRTVLSTERRGFRDMISKYWGSGAISNAAWLSCRQRAAGVSRYPSTSCG